jgi:hypothetical protein
MGMSKDFQDGDRVFAVAGNERVYGTIHRIDTEEHHRGLLVFGDDGQFSKVRHIHSQARHTAWVVWDIGSKLPNGPFNVLPVEECAAAAA